MISLLGSNILRIPATANTAKNKEAKLIKDRILIHYMVKKGKVDSMPPEAQEQAIQMKAKGLTTNAITDEINKLFSSDITSGQMKAYLARKNNKIFREAKNDKDFNDKMVQNYWNTVAQLTEVNTKVYSAFLELSKDPEFISKKVECPECDHKFNVQMKSLASFLKASEVLMAQIKHVDQVIGKLNNGAVNITYNFVDLSKKLTLVLPQILETAQRVGIIKNYNKTRMQEFMKD